MSDGFSKRAFDLLAEPAGLDRRAVVAAIVASGALPSAAFAGAPGSQGADQLFADVEAYDGQGEHRTATAADHACSLWLLQRLRQAGLQADLQRFPAPLFEPQVCRVQIGEVSLPAFPVWPVAATGTAGLSAPLVEAHDGSVEGKIAIIRLPYGPGGTWAKPGFGDAVSAIAQSRPAAIVAVTEGATGTPIALNVAEQLQASVPIVIVGSASEDVLVRAVKAQDAATVFSTGRASPVAEATNMVAWRKGRGKTVVISTPKSGWFHCAGERGSGIAVFIALAERLARSTNRDLLFVASSGHELGELGAAHFLRTRAPAPEDVGCWLHIGANAAMRALSVDRGQVVAAPDTRPSHRVSVTSGLLPAAGQAFTSERGYSPPALLMPNAAGELDLFQKAGYRTLAGLGGSNPVFHTRLDRGVSTSPDALKSVFDACTAFFAAIETSL